MFNAPYLQSLPSIQCYPNTASQLRISSRVILVFFCVYEEESSLDLDLQHPRSTHISFHDKNGRPKIPSGTFATRLVACHWTTAAKFNHCSSNRFPHCHNRLPFFSSISSCGISDNLLLIWGTDIFPCRTTCCIGVPSPLVYL